MKKTKTSKQAANASTARSENVEGSEPEAATATVSRPGKRSKTPPKPLSSDEKRILKAKEQIITQSLRDSWELAEALTAIREAELYRESYKSFKEYCRKRWWLSHCRARQLINALAVRKLLGDRCGTEKLPQTECQVRPLTHLLEKPDLLAKAWKSAWSTAGGQPTGDQVRKAVQVLAPRKPRSGDAKMAGLLRGLKVLREAAAGVDDGLAAILDGAVARVTTLQNSQEVKPSKGRKAKA